MREEALTPASVSVQGVRDTYSCLTRRGVHAPGTTMQASDFSLQLMKLGHFPTPPGFSIKLQLFLLQPCFSNDATCIVANMSCGRLCAGVSARFCSFECELKSIRSVSIYIYIQNEVQSLQCIAINQQFKKGFVSSM